jgi:hypothetical protein
MRPNTGQIWSCDDNRTTAARLKFASARAVSHGMPQPSARDGPLLAPGCSYSMPTYHPRALLSRV